MVFVAFHRDAQHETKNMKKKSATLIVVPLGKALNEISLFLCGRQIVSRRESQLTTANEAGGKRINPRPASNVFNSQEARRNCILCFVDF